MPLRMLAVAAWLIAALLPLGAEPVDVSFDRGRIDLLAHVEAVESMSPQATIELPATAGMARRSIPLNARGPGPLYRWAVFTLHNPAAAPQHLVVAARHQRFVGSSVVWPRREGSRIISLATAEGRAVEPLASLGADTFALTLPPETTTSYVLEVSATGLDSLSLWRSDAFHATAEQYAVFRGMVLGISILLGISFLCLLIVSRRAEFPAAALFGWSAIAFLVIEAGYLPALSAWLPVLSGNEQSLRAVIEAVMLTGIIAALVSFVELRREMPLVGMALLACGAAAAALAIYGWFEPRLATGLARIGFAAVVAAGLGLIVMLWQRGAARAQAALFGWVVLALWTAAAALGALNLVDSALMQPLISAGLVLVLVTMGFTLAQFAFPGGLVSGGALEEAGRRSMALAASEQAVWDWQVDQGRLHVGPEIERALGFDEGALGEDAARWLELLHPIDRPAYVAALEAAERRGRGRFSQEFRLRRADGRYRWFLLRGRAIAGSEEGASRLIGTLSDVTALRRSEDRLLADAVRDRLTGLPNRALFLDRLGQAMRRASESTNGRLYVIAIGLDRFKSFNDALGTEAGDYLLHTVGRRLRACVGPDDTLARLRGDQFAIIWNSDQRDFEIDRLSDAVSAAVAQPVNLPAGEVVMTASMGVVRLQPEHSTPEGMLKQAEIALYEAKRRAYGAVEFFRPDMHDERSELLQLEQGLRHALERNEIEVVYQPIIRLGDRKLAGFEALMRWRRGDIVLEPDSFVGLAEETGLIGDLGRYVLKEATRRLGIWQRAFRPQEPLFVAVNISSMQLLNGDLVEDIQGFIEREGIKGGTLKLELTESLIVQNPELAHKLLTRLKQMGVALACDDFGTGYSGLASVFRLPFDTVKIDRSFLEADSGERNWVVVEAIVRLARELGLDVVAEGIETDEQMERLGALGCDFGQGYLIGPPVTAQQVVEALGGVSYRANGLGAGLAAFWTRMIGRKGEEPAGPMPPDGDPVRPPAAIASNESGIEDNDTDLVLDVRAVLPPASKPSPRPVPEVGSVPFAPRRVKSGEPARREAASSQARAAEPGQPPAGDLPTPQPAPLEPAAAAAEGVRILVVGPGADAAPSCDPGRNDSPSKAARDSIDTAKRPRPPGTNPLRRKVLRAAKAGPAKPR